MFVLYLNILFVMLRHFCKKQMMSSVIYMLLMCICVYVKETVDVEALFQPIFMSLYHYTDMGSNIIIPLSD